MGDAAAVVKAYDIRGVVDDELDEDLVETFGARFARLVPEGEVIVGHDMRRSSPRLTRAFVRGVLGQGSDVVRIGLASTDMLSYASAALGRPGAMITASHNPPHYNGIKLCRAHAEPVGWNTGLRTLLDMARAPAPARTTGTGTVRDHSVLAGYRDHLLALAAPATAPARRITAVVEAGGGMAGLSPCAPMSSASSSPHPPPRPTRRTPPRHRRTEGEGPTMTTHDPAPQAKTPQDDEQTARLWQLAFGSMPAQIIHAAVRLGLPDALADGPRTCAELARSSGADEMSLRRLLRGMDGAGIVAPAGPDRYALTPMGRPLRSDVPDSLCAMVLLFAGEAMWRSWGDLAETVRTGRNGFERIHGVPYFTYYAQRPEDYAVFNSAMGEDTKAVGPALAQGYDFSWCKTVVDVGGGNGALLSCVLAAHPGLQGIVFDRPEGVAQAGRLLAEAGVADRCTAVAGDAFDEVVRGGDLYLMKSVLHDWDDERVSTLLRNCRDVIPDDGRILVMEPLMPLGTDDLGPAHGIVTTDMDLLVTTRGRVRTEAEFAQLFASAGFRHTMTRKLADHGYLEAHYHSVVEGVPV
ncbi:methyltransferase [Streptomyces sp. NPDC004629]|uniref:methyltransferase n=1 Tax=Streptomyces sp. NPDC004629 TaxID=3364705 RepID=UPI00368BED83